MQTRRSISWITRVSSLSLTIVVNLIRSPAIVVAGGAVDGAIRWHVSIRRHRPVGHLADGGEGLRRAATDVTPHAIGHRVELALGSFAVSDRRLVCDRAGRAGADDGAVDPKAHGATVYVAAMTLQSRVDAIFGRPADHGISLAMVVMQGGEVVAERYGTQPATAFGPAVEVDADSTLISWSMAKSVTHAAIGILVADGAVDLEMAAPVAEWQGTPKAQIRVIDLLEMRSGLQFVEDYVDGGTSHCIAMLFGDGAADHASYAAALPLVREPGTVWNYSSGTTNIVTRIISGIVGGGRVGMERFLADRLFEPAGMTSAIPKFDDAGTFVGSSYVYATARDFARFGELYRNDGVAENGARVLPEGWADHGRTRVAHDPTDDLAHGFDYGRHWWMWPQYPGSIAAHGYEGQFAIVVPDRQLTVVHLGKTDAGVRRHLVEHLDGLITAASTTT